MKAEELINNNVLSTGDLPYIVNSDGTDQQVVFTEIGLTAVNMARLEMKEKAIDAFKENCQHLKDAKGCECKLCVRYVGGHCEFLEGFIERLNKKA